MAGLGSYKNRVLRVNLSARAFTNNLMDKDVIRNFIGGRGFGIYNLRKELASPWVNVCVI